jgi:hypothetical protein
MYSMQWAMDYLYEASYGTAIRYAAEKRNLAESIAELHEIANGHDDILAEAAGITAGSWYARPVTHVGHGLIAVGMLILADGGAGTALTMLSWSGGRVLVSSGGARHSRGALLPTSVPEWGTALSGPVGHVNPRIR